MRVPGGRKFTVVVLSLVGSFVLALFKLLTPEFAQVVSICVGAFMLAHAVQDFKNGKAP